MKKLLLVICSAGCWACIIGAWVTWGYKAAATVALATLLMAIIAAVLIHEFEDELTDAIVPLKEFLSNMEDDGK